MAGLSDLPNIGTELERQLMTADIHTPEQLAALGSREAFRRIAILDSSACINRLYALEGAILGIRWHHLPQDTKDELKAFLRSQKDVR